MGVVADCDPEAMFAVAEALLPTLARVRAPRRALACAAGARAGAGAPHGRWPRTQRRASARGRGAQDPAVSRGPRRKSRRGVVARAAKGAGRGLARGHARAATPASLPPTDSSSARGWH